MGKYFTEIERYKLETMLEDKIPITQIANRLNKSRQTIYNEIKRGTVEQLDSDLVKHYVYKADYAQKIFSENQTAKGRDYKIGCDHALVSFIEEKIKKEKWSPDAIVGYIREKKMEFTDICTKTLYNYIHAGLFLNVSEKDLKKYQKKKGKVASVPLHNYKNRSIEERPDLSDRESFGNWEMDTVVSGRSGRSCLLVLSERKTRYELIRKIKAKSQNDVKAALDQIEKSLKGTFPDIFKTITMDNGVEFLDQEKIERSCSGTGSRTTAYYCHAYASWERGTNENINKMIRKWIPKGANIDKYSEEYIAKVEKWVNEYPRKILDYKSSGEMLVQFV